MTNIVTNPAGKSSLHEMSADLEAVNEALETAHDYNLELEVVWSALRAVKNDPSLSIADAMAMGLNEWDL